MTNILSSLSEEQKKCVTKNSGPMIIISGPGSGKTRVITSKIAHLISTGLSPSNILSLTFTNKSAKEMIARAQEMVPNHNMNNLWIGTFHSVFAKILRIESEAIGFNYNFTILDNDDSKNIVKRIIKELSLDSDIYKANSIFAKISLMKNNLITPDKYKQNEELIEKDKSMRQSSFVLIYSKYEETCKKSESMDFDSLLLNTLILFNNSPEILEKYQNKFEYTLIDEFQDTNVLQLEIIKKIVKKNRNLCVVGDDSQSIYSFRGANINNILNFQKIYPESEEFKLEQNYRSNGNIVEAANNLIRNNDNRLKKTIWTKKEKGEKIKVIESKSDNEEGFMIASAIKHVTQKSNKSIKNNLVLYRMNSQSRSIEEGMRNLGLNYRIFGGISFYKRKEIKDLIAYFRFVINTKDEESLLRIINFPTRGIGNTTIEKVKSLAIEKNKSMWEIILEIAEDEINMGNRTNIKIKDFATLINNLIARKQIEAYNFTCELIEIIKLIPKLKEVNNLENLNRLENIKEFVNALKIFSEQNNENTIDKFLEEVSLVNDNEYNLSESSKKDEEFVSLMTIHQSKGLEFDYVYVVGLEENIFPSQQSMFSKKDLEEERRLFYVAITRAKKAVYLSHCNTRFKWGNYVENPPSRFLEEIKEQCIYIRETKKVSFENKKKVTKYYKKPNSNTKNKNYNITTKRNLTKINPKLNNLGTIKNKTYNLKIGVKISHNIFGIGTILKIEGELENEKVHVQFANNETKIILIRYAKFDLID